MFWGRKMYPTESDNLTAESVQGASLALEGVDHIHGSHGLPLGVLGVGDGITDDVLEENLENTTGLLVDEAGDALDTATASQTADGGLGDTLDVIPEDFPMALSASFAESLSSFAASSHVDGSCVEARMTLRSAVFAFYTERAAMKLIGQKYKGGFSAF